MRHWWSEQDKAQFKADADMILVHAEYYDLKFRSDHKDHKCASLRVHDIKHPEIWFCNHLIGYRNRMMSKMTKEIYNENVARTERLTGLKLKRL